MSDSTLCSGSRVRLFCAVLITRDVCPSVGSRVDLLALLYIVNVELASS